MALNAASPSTHKGKIQRTSDGGTCQWNHSAGPLLGGFLPELDRQPPRDAWRDFLEHLLFDKILAVIDSRGSRGGFPHFEARVLTARFEAVKEAEALNEAQGDEREQAGVRKKRDHAAETEARALRERQTLGIADERCGNGVEALQRNVFHAREIRNPEAVLARKFPAKDLRIDFDGAEATAKAEAKKTAENAAARGFPRGWM